MLKPRSHLVVIPLMLLLLNAACSTEPETQLGQDVDPPNSTPERAVESLFAAYVSQDTASYLHLLAPDYVFNFSDLTDPDLVTEYDDGWIIEDEADFLRNLFVFGVRRDGSDWPSALEIETVLSSSTSYGDTAAGRDSTKYRTLEVAAWMDVHLPPSGSFPERSSILVGGFGEHHRFHLVRGDVAVNLAQGQVADENHWYIWQWNEVYLPQGGPDKQLRLSGGETATPVFAASWGGLKGLYHSQAPPPMPPPIPDNSTPENTIRRFIAAYETMNAGAYEGLFTADFTFEFSPDTDPDLVQQYSSGWFKEDERVSSANLFTGGVNSQGDIQSPASRIELTLANMIPSDDNSEGRDPQLFKTLSTPVTLEIEVPAAGGDPIVFEIGFGADLTRHRFFLVRGDAASSLDQDQPADDQHWYIWRWIDESLPVTSALALRGRTELAPAPASESTWGRIKALYR